jgi:hypothetical protein
LILCWSTGSQLVSISAVLQHSLRDYAAIAVMDIIARHSESLNDGNRFLSSFCYDALERLKCQLPNLRSVFIHDAEGCMEYQSMFRLVPLLQTVPIRNYYPSWFLLPGSPLAELPVECHLVDEGFEMLSISPHISCCSLAGLGEWDSIVRSP